MLFNVVIFFQLFFRDDFVVVGVVLCRVMLRRAENIELHDTWG